MGAPSGAEPGVFSTQSSGDLTGLQSPQQSIPSGSEEWLSLPRFRLTLVISELNTEISQPVAQGVNGPGHTFK